MILQISGFFPWEEALAQEQHRRELLEKAKHQRLIQQVSERGTMSYQLLLAQLGEQLVKWGCHLQARYGTLTEASNSIRYIKVLRRQFSAPDTGIGLSPCLGKR